MSGILLYLTSKSDRLLNLNIVALQTLHQKGCIGQDFWAEATLKIEKTTKNKNIRLRWLRSGLLCNRSDPQLAMCLIFLIKLLPSIHYTIHIYKQFMQTSKNQMQDTNTIYIHIHNAKHTSSHTFLFTIFCRFALSFYTLRYLFFYLIFIFFQQWHFE